MVCTVCPGDPGKEVGNPVSHMKETGHDKFIVNGKQTAYFEIPLKERQRLEKEAKPEKPEKDQ